MTTAVERPFDEVDISSQRFWGLPALEQDRDLAILTRERPVSWHRPLDGAMSNDEDHEGFWAITGHPEVIEVSQQPDIFSSSGDYGGAMFDNVPIQVLEYGSSFLIMDPPQHTKLRKLISAAFTPKRVAKIEEQIRNQARQIVDDFVHTEGTVDFVEHVSTRLPMWTMSEMIGVPEYMRKDMIAGANSIVGFSDPADGLDADLAMFTALGSLMDLGQTLIAERRKKPEDDLLTALTSAEVDGEKLTDEQINSFFVLLCGAGTDTTRNATSMTMEALAQHWDQWEYLAQDIPGRIKPAVNEFVRWASPVMTFRRTATVDFEIAGQTIRCGEKVVMFYRPANRDERVFENPFVFDVKRDPNNHIAFGGRGPHMCLGNNVARTQLQAVFSELLERVDTIEVDAAEYVPNATFIRGVKQMTCRVTGKN